MNHHVSAATVVLASLASVAFCGCSANNCGPSPVPDRYPLGSVNQTHYQTMETNAEAADFILHRNEFVGNTSQLTPYGKDHILEIAARARRAPFPIVIERSESNADPKLDDRRRTIVAQVLSDCGLSDAQKRTIVAPAYGKGLTGREAEADFGRYAESPGAAKL